MRVSLQKKHGEPLQKHAWRGWNKHKHRLNWPQLSINGRESPLYSRGGMYEVILGGYGTLKNDYMTFYIRPVNAKKTFPLQFCELFLFRIA